MRAIYVHAKERFQAVLIEAFACTCKTNMDLAKRCVQPTLITWQRAMVYFLSGNT